VKALLSILAGVFLSLPAVAEVWEKQCIDSSGIHRGEFNSLAVDNTNVSHVAYYDQDYGDLRYAVQTNGIWNLGIVDSVEDRGMYCSVALDPQGQPHISYVAENTWGKDSLTGFEWTGQVLKRAVRSASGWTTEIVDSTMRPFLMDWFWHTSLRFDAQGNPGISYSVLRDSMQLKYAHFDGSTWQTNLVKGLYVLADFTGLVYKDGTLPVIAFQEPVSIANPVSALRFAYPDGTGKWNIVTTPLDVSETGALGFDIDAANNLYFLSLGADDSLRVATYNWQSWQVEAIYYKHDQTGIINSATLKVDRQGQPAVVVMDSRQIRFIRKVAGMWQRKDIETLPVNWWPTDVSLSFDTYNNPSFSLAVNIPRGSITGKGLFYYHYWPGIARMELPQASHDFGTVWTQSYADWKCVVRSAGEAPLVLSKLQFNINDAVFQIVNTPLPAIILPQDSTFITVRFTPAAAQQYSRTLTVSSNDTAHPEEQIPLTGSGTASGTSGTLSVTTYDCTYDSATGNLKSDQPLAGASISLYHYGNLVAGPAMTGASGQATLADVPVGDYDLRISKIVTIPYSTTNDTLSQRRTVTIGPGVTSTTLIYPAGIVLQKYASVYRMRNIPLNFFMDTTYHASYPSEDDVENLLQLWGQNLPANTAPSAARLLLAEDMMHTMFYNGAHSYREFVSDIGELINMLFYSDGWLNSLLKVLKLMWDLLKAIMTGDIAGIFDLLEPFLKYMIMGLMDDAVSQAASELPCVTVPEVGNKLCLKEEVVMPAWHAVKSNYSGLGAYLPVGGFSSTAWDKMKAIIYRVLYRAMFEIVYVHWLTDSKLQTAINKSENFDFGGDLKTAYDKTVAFNAHRLDEDYQLVSLASNFRTAADVFHQVSVLLEVLGEIPGLGFLSSMATVAKYSSYAEVAVGMGLSGYAFFSLPGHIGDAIDDIYHPPGAEKPAIRGPCDCPGQKLDKVLLLTLKRDLMRSTVGYDSALAAIRSCVIAGQRIDAFLQLKNLSHAEVDYNNTLRVSSAPINAVTWKARDSIASFRAMHDTLAIRKGQAGESRLKNYFWIMALSVDSTSSTRDSVLVQLDRSSARNHIIADQVAALLDTVSSLSMPAVLVATAVTQDAYALSPGKVATVQFRIQNVGGVAADSVNVRLTTNPAIRLGESDSIAIGSLASGQQSVTFTRSFTYAGPGYTKGAWTAQIKSGASAVGSFSGAFSTPSIVTPGTGGRLASANIYNYPNPFNPERTTTTLRYSLASSAQVSIKIYDAGGILVKNVIENSPMNAADEQATPWDGRNGAGNIVANGVYFFVIESSAGERAVGKIAVIR